MSPLPRWPGLLLMAIMVIIGLAVYKDYGVSWDELAMRQIGEVNLKFMREGDDKLMQGFANKDHGASFEVPLIWIEEALKPAHIGKVIQMRHLATYLFYVLGIWCGYLLALRVFRKQWLALLGVVMLILEPRMFAHAFFNTKDMPFLSAMVIALYAICVAFQGRRYYQYMLAGAACAFAIGIRTPGIILAVPAGAIMILDIIKARVGERKQAALRLLSFTLVAIAVLYACWPALWHYPLHNLYDSLRSFTKYQGWDNHLMFDGIMHQSTKLPWHYVPGWIAISTPIVWLALGLVGIFMALRRFIRGPLTVLETVRGRILALCGIVFLVPVCAAIVLHSVLYDDWRHLYFVYPAFVMLALYSVEVLARKDRIKKAVTVACVIQAITTVWVMISIHPFQQVYFNRLVSHRPEYLRQHYDFEYWGASFKQGLEWVLEHDSRDTIPVEETLFPLKDNWKALQATTKKQIRWTENLTPGSYFMDIYRQHPDDYPFLKVHSIKALNSSVLDVYVIPDNARKDPADAHRLK